MESLQLRPHFQTLVEHVYVSKHDLVQCSVGSGYTQPHNYPSYTYWVRVAFLLLRPLFTLMLGQLYTIMGLILSKPTYYTIYHLLRSFHFPFLPLDIFANCVVVLSVQKYFVYYKICQPPQPRFIYVICCIPSYLCVSYKYPPTAIGLIIIYVSIFRHHFRFFQGTIS